MCVCLLHPIFSTRPPISSLFGSLIIFGEEYIYIYIIYIKVKVKQSHYWPGMAQISRKLRFPDYVTMAQDGGKVVSLTQRPPLPPGNTPGTHFC